MEFAAALSKQMSSVFKPAAEAATRDTEKAAAKSEAQIASSLGRDTFVRTATAAPKSLDGEVIPRGEGRVLVKGKQLQYEDGTPFVPSGPADAFGVHFQRMNDPKTLDAYYQHLHQDAGTNFINVQAHVEDPNFYGQGPADLYKLHFENGVFKGVEFNEQNALEFDRLLDTADKHDINVLTYLFDTFHMDFNWKTSPWNVANGGPLEYPSDMVKLDRVVKDPTTGQDVNVGQEVKKAQEAIFQYAIDRWGDRKNFAGIELMNEWDWAIAGPLDGNKDAQGVVHGASNEDLANWFNTVPADVQQYMKQKFGDQPHPFLMATSNNPNRVEDFVGKNPNIDVVGVHGYIWPPAPSADAPLDLNVHGPTTDPVHPLDAFDPMKQAMQRQVGATDKPVLDTENGPLGWFIKPHGDQTQFPNDDRFENTLNNVEFYSGAAGPGMRWPYPNFGFQDHPFINPLTPAMDQNLLADQKIASYVDWSTFNRSTVSNELATADPSLLTTGTRDEHQMMGWLVKDDRTDTRPTVSSQVNFSGFADEPHDVLWLDSKSGSVQKQEATTGSSFSATTPEFADSVSVVVRPRS